MGGVLEGLAELAKSKDSARFSKEAMYSSRKMGSRISAKEEVLSSMSTEADVPSFLRRKKMQDKAQFIQPPEDDPKNKAAGREGDDHLLLFLRERCPVLAQTQISECHSK